MKQKSVLENRPAVSKEAFNSSKFTEPRPDTGSQLQAESHRLDRENGQRRQNRHAWHADGALTGVS